MTLPTTVPQRDSLQDAEQRNQQLYASRQQYKYDRDYLAPLSMLFIPHAYPPSPEEDVIGPLRVLPDPERVSPAYLYPHPTRRWPRTSPTCDRIRRAGCARTNSSFPSCPPRAR